MSLKIKRQLDKLEDNRKRNVTNELKTILDNNSSLPQLIKGMNIGDFSLRTAKTSVLLASIQYIRAY